MNTSEKNVEKLVEVDRTIVGLLGRRCTLALMIKKGAEEKLVELREGYGYDNLFLNSMRETAEKPLNDVIKQADELIAQSKQMKEMLLNPQDKHSTVADEKQITDAIRQGVQKAIHGTAE